MALTVTHPFVSAVVDENNPGEVGPGEWNAPHSVAGTLDAAQMPALTGDITSSAGAVATTLATVNGNVGTFGSATQATQVTYNAKGLATAVANVTVTPAVGSITGFGTSVAAALAVNVGSAGSVVVNGGALGTPSSGTLTSCTGLPVSTGISGLGTGVATALAVNIGSAGAFVTFNGALGTPSSGTLTSCTGLPVSTGIAGFGTGVATALAVNVGSAGAPVVLNGAGGTPSSLTLTNATGLPIAGVTGLATSTTDNAAVRYDGTGGNQQNSALIVADTTAALSRSGNGGVPVQGSNTNDSAAAGNVGEFVESEVLVGSAVSLTTLTSTNVTTISLTAGDWDVDGVGAFTIQDGVTTFTLGVVWISTTSATFPTVPNKGAINYWRGSTTADLAAAFNSGTRRISVSATTTVYLSVFAAFSGGTCSAFGYLRARRVR